MNDLREKLLEKLYQIGKLTGQLEVQAQILVAERGATLDLEIRHIATELNEELGELATFCDNLLRRCEKCSNQ